MRRTGPHALRAIAVLIAFGALSLAVALVLDMSGNDLVNAYRLFALVVFARMAEMFWRRGSRRPEAAPQRSNDVAR